MDEYVAEIRDNSQSNAVSVEKHETPSVFCDSLIITFAERVFEYEGDYSRPRSSFTDPCPCPERGSRIFSNSAFGDANSFPFRWQ